MRIAGMELWTYVYGYHSHPLYLACDTVLRRPTAVSRVAFAAAVGITHGLGTYSAQFLMLGIIGYFPLV